MPDKITAQQLISYRKVEVNENTEMPTLGSLYFSPKLPGLRCDDNNRGQQYRSQGCYTYFTHHLAPFLFQRERKRDFAHVVTPCAARWAGSGRLLRRRRSLDDEFVDDVLDESGAVRATERNRVRTCRQRCQHEVVPVRDSGRVCPRGQTEQVLPAQIELERRRLRAEPAFCDPQSDAVDARMQVAGGIFDGLDLREQLIRGLARDVHVDDVHQREEENAPRRHTALVANHRTDERSDQEEHVPRLA